MEATKKQALICGGTLALTASKEFSTVSGRFESIKVGDYCTECPFQILCAMQLAGGSRPKKDPKPLPPREFPKVMVYAFTGMPIGELEIIGDLATVLEVETKGGQKLVFDKKSGLQTNCKNPKYANKIDPRP